MTNINSNLKLETLNKIYLIDSDSNFKDQDFYKITKLRNYNISIFNIYEQTIDMESIIINILECKEINYLYVKNAALQYVKKGNNIIDCLEKSYDKVTKNINSDLVNNYHNNNFINIFIDTYKNYVENSKIIKKIFYYYNSHNTHLNSFAENNSYSVIDIIKNDAFYKNIMSDKLYDLIEKSSVYITDFIKYNDLLNIELYFKLYNGNKNKFNFDTEINSENICTSIDNMIRNISRSYQIEKDIKMIRDYIEIGNKISGNTFKNIYYNKMIKRIKNGSNIKIEEEFLRSLKKNLLMLKFKDYCESEKILSCFNNIHKIHFYNKYSKLKIYPTNISLDINYNPSLIKVSTELPSLVRLYVDMLCNIYKQIHKHRIFNVNYDNTIVNMDIEIDDKIITIDISLSEITKNKFFYELY